MTTETDDTFAPWDAPYTRCGARGYTASPPPHLRARCTANKGHVGPHHDGTWATWTDDHPVVVALNELEAARERDRRQEQERADAEAAARARIAAVLPDDLPVSSLLLSKSWVQLADLLDRYADARP